MVLTAALPSPTVPTLALPMPPSATWRSSPRSAHQDSLRIRRMVAVQAGVRAEWDYVQANRAWFAERAAELGLDKVVDDDAY